MDRNTGIRGSQIKNLTILPEDLLSTNAKLDNYTLKYDNATGKFTWVEISIDGTLVGNSDNAIPTEKAVKSYIDSFTGVDDFTIERVSAKLQVKPRLELNTMLLAFKIAVNEGFSKFNMIDGIMDEFEDETGVDTATSTNETYDLTNDLYQPESSVGGIDSDTKLMLHGNGVDASLEILDDGNTGHIITQNGDATLSTTQKKWGSSACYFDGTGDYLTIPDSADWDWDETNMTLDFWVKHDDPIGQGLEHYIMQNQDATNHVYLHNNSSLPQTRFYITVADSWKVDMYTAGGGGITDSTWHHIAVIKVGSDWGIYLDGTQVSYDSSAELPSITGSLYIGSYAGTGQYFKGYMDEIRIQHSNYFSASPNSTPDDTITVPTIEHTSDSNTKLLLHMNTQDVSGDGTSGNYHIPKFWGDAELDTAVKKWGSGSYLFDGTLDHIMIPISSDFNICASASDDWTIDMWVKHTDHVGYEAYMVHYDAGANNYWHLVHNHASGLLFSINGNIGEILATGYGGEITDTDWHHIAVCKVGDEYAVYKDGTQINYTQDTSTMTLANGVLGIGARNSSGGTGSGSDWHFAGSMDEIRVQHSNHFSASPNSGKTDTITIPTAEYSSDSGTLNMTLQSNVDTAEAIPDTGRIVLFEEDVDAITLNTDLKAYMSRDGGSTWGQATLTDEGDYDNNIRILTGTVDFTASGIGSGTSIKWKLVTANTKDLKLHAVGENWD